MKQRVWIVDCEVCKSAADVLTCAGRVGDWNEVYTTPFFSTFTKKERRDYLRGFVFRVNDANSDTKLKLKECQLVKGEVVSMDSTNMTHANAYYKVWIEVPRRIVAGTPMEEVMEEIP
jgi:hypothetical protein